jgi:hypothetical protein
MSMVWHMKTCHMVVSLGTPKSDPLCQAELGRVGAGCAATNSQ